METHSIEVDHIVVNKDDEGATVAAGVVFIEAQLKDDFKGSINEILDEIRAVFNSGIVKDLVLKLWDELLASEAYEGLFPDCLQSIKAVEYVGRDLLTSNIRVKDISVQVDVYRLINAPEIEEGSWTLLHGEVTELPSYKFEGVWQRLVFDSDIQENLVRLMTNMLKFSRALERISKQSRMNRLVLLSGPPGTGKTTLCQALAQKVSIRLNSWFKETKLIQLNAATLLSKFFSESAKYVFEIFKAIERMCHESPDRFVCVLIDEVESLASSRITASERGEVQDSIRATNALLTGFDRVKGQANLIILCTSNMAETLDAAFLDRCGHHIRVGLPAVATQYQILRDAIHELISCKIIRTNCSIPCYRDAKMTQVLGPNNPGSMLLRLCSILDNQSAQSVSFERLKSARFLGQLPEWALADRLKTDSCDLDEALQHIAKFISDNIMVTRGLKRKLEQRLTSVEIDGCIAPTVTLN